MQELQVSFSSRYHTYAQLERQGNIVLYRRFPRASGNVCHEVAVVRIMPAHISPTGFDVPDVEVYPAEDALDRTLWRFDSRQDAEQQFRRVVNRAAQAAAEQPPPEPPAAAAVAAEGLQPGGSQGGSD